jgi:hypothetical protein
MPSEVELSVEHHVFELEARSDLQRSHCRLEFHFFVVGRELGFPREENEKQETGNRKFKTG